MIPPVWGLDKIGLGPLRRLVGEVSLCQRADVMGEGALLKDLLIFQGGGLSGEAAVGLGLACLEGLHGQQQGGDALGVADLAALQEGGYLIDGDAHHFYVFVEVGVEDGRAQVGG